MPPESYAYLVAYQRSKLLEIQKLYDRVDLDLGYLLQREQNIAVELDAISQEYLEIRKTLTDLGANLPKAESEHGPTESMASVAQKTYPKIDLANPSSMTELTRLAKLYLEQHGVDLTQDPLLQILPADEITRIATAYRSKYGDVTWDQSDYLVVILAALIGTLLDIFVVKIPADMNFLGTAQTGSPLTRWIKDHSASIYNQYTQQLENQAKVSFDVSMNKEIAGLSPKMHRLMSLGHDPLMGLIIGTIDIMHQVGTYVDMNGKLIQLAADASDNLVNPTSAFVKEFLHLLSDMFTSAGIPVPLFPLLQLIKSDSPFVLGSSGEKVPWVHVARFMYSHGYDLRHFFAMGIVPASVEMIVRGWWLLKTYPTQENAELTKIKLASMLMLGHTLAMSGNLLKTKLLYQMNPLALNWAEILALLPVTISWARETITRNQLIREKLDAEWISIYNANLRLAENVETARQHF